MTSIANDPGAPEAERPQVTTPAGLVARASGLIFVISGPSGVGKDTIKKCLQDQDFPIGYCVTATTRPAREGEIHGLHYYFVTDAEFEEMLRSGELIEHAVVHGKYSYGIPFEGLRAGLRSGMDVMLTPDVQGAEALRALLPNTVSIFLAPSSLEALRPRIERRNATPEEVARRMKTAAGEMLRLGEFDYIVVNEDDKLDVTVEKVKAIITAERVRVKPRRVVL